MVEAATRCPSRRSSPWILTTPHRVFSRARRTNQRDELLRYRRAARRPGLAPLRRHQPPVPAQQRAGSHDPPGPQPFRHDPRQRGEDGPVGPGHARSGVGPAQHGHLVPQRQYLHVLGRRGPGQQREPGQHGYQQPVSQRDTHGCRSCRRRNPRSNQRPSIRPLQAGPRARSTTPGRCRYTRHATDGGGPARPGAAPARHQDQRGRAQRESPQQAHGHPTYADQAADRPQSPDNRPVTAKGRCCLIR